MRWPAKLKGRIEQLSRLGQGPFRHARVLGEFGFLSFQRGPREGVAKVFLIMPGQIEEIAGLIDEPEPAELLRVVLARAAEIADRPMTSEGAERMGLVAHHLFSPKQDVRGVPAAAFG